MIRHAHAATRWGTGSTLGTFGCWRFRKERAELIGTRSTWKELDAPMWVKEGDQDPYDAIEAFFSYLYSQLANCCFVVYSAWAGRISSTALESSRNSEGLIMALLQGRI